MLMRTIAVLLVSAIASTAAMSGPGEDKAKAKAQKNVAPKNVKNSPAAKQKASQPGDDRPAKRAGK